MGTVIVWVGSGILYFHKWSGEQKEEAVITDITEGKGDKNSRYTRSTITSVCPLRAALTSNFNKECFHYDPLALRVDFVPSSRRIKKINEGRVNT